MTAGGRTDPRFSVLLPTHNRPDVLALAIESALRQTDDRFELLVAGDGCTDQTADIVQSFRDPRVRWFDSPKAPGIGYASRNAALRQANGWYVAYLSHDDFWFPDHLERLGRVLDETGAELVHSRLLGVDVGGELRPFAYNLEVPSHPLGLADGRMAMSITCVAHTRACFEKYGYWDESLLRGGDVELWHRIALKGGFRNLAFVTEPTALHFVADWRNTSHFRKRRRLSRRLVDGLSEAPAPVLQLDIREGETPQAAAWRELQGDPGGYVRALRHATVQYHDALLWSAHSTAGLMAFRAGARLGAALDRVWRRMLWVSSPEWSRWNRTVRERTRQVEEQVELDARAPGGRAG